MGVHGLIYQGLDIPLNQAEPYYRGKYEESGDFGFFDRPRRIDYSQAHQWIARSFLVEEIAPKTVVVYNGIQWGWENRIYPNNNNSCPNPSLRTVSGETNITTSSSLDSIDALQEIDCPPPPPPDEPSPPPPDEPPPDCPSGIPNCCSCTGLRYGDDFLVASEGILDLSFTMNATIVSDASEFTALPAEETLKVGKWLGKSWDEECNQAKTDS